MNKFYLILFLICFSFVAHAQEAKTGEGSPISNPVEARVIKFYPNPATTVINFEFFKPVQRDVTLQVYNFVGKKVYELNSITQKTAVSLTDFYRGVYIFQLRDKSGRIMESGKFQVNK
jgi:hypothetical protein